MKTLLLAILILSTPCFAAVATGMRVAHLKGDVRFNGQPVNEGEELATAGVLETGIDADSFADLVYPAGHMIRLKSKTRVRVETFVEGLPTLFQVLYGKTFAYFVKGPGAKKIQLKTKAVVAGVRGTEYMIEEDPDKGTYVCVCKGSVNIKGIGEHESQGERVVKAGQDLWIKPKEDMGKPKKSKSMSAMTAKEFKAMGH